MSRMSKVQKEKNIKDLEYNRILNVQNIWVILLGTAIISVLLTNTLPLGTNKGDIIFLLGVSLIAVLIYYPRKLEEKAKEIRKL